jgi:NTE family protein
MFGAWQAGAWRALAGRFQFDMVIGASAGALNGWAIACGMTPDEIAAQWLDQETANLIRPRIGPTFFDPKPLHRAARALYERSQPQMPFAVTLVEVPMLKLHLARGPEITWQHLAATCSIPTAFPPMRIGKRWYVDGGLLGALPLWAAAEMGATEAIAIDALPVLPSKAIHAVAGLARALGRKRQPPESLRVTRILPLKTLGGLSDSLYWNPKNARRWLEQGEHDAALSITM